MLILKCIPYESDTMRLKKYFKWLARVNTYLSAWVESVIQVVNLGCLQYLKSVALVRESCLHNQFHLCELVKVSPNFDFVDCSRSILFTPLAIAKIFSRYML
jgi:hypothetical protein